MKININGSVVEISNDDLKKAIEENKEEVSVSSDEIVVRTKEAFETYTNNLKSESQQMGAEIGRKEVFKALELDFEGTGAHKSVDKSVEFLNGWKDGLIEEAQKAAGQEPNAKLKSALEDIEKLRSNLAEKDNAIAKAQEEFLNYKMSGKRKELIMSHIPDNTILPKEDIYRLIEPQIKTAFENDSIIPLGNDGNPLKDPQTLEVVGIDVPIKSIFESNPQYLKAAQGGNGGTDSGGGNAKQSIEDFTKEMTEQGIQVNGAQFNQIMNQRMEAGTLDV